MSARAAPAGRDAAVHWHDAECGAYAADLSLWEELAAEADGPVVDLGCGTGRVALHLAQRGREVIGLDRSEELVDSLVERAEELPVRGVVADARDFELGERFGLMIAPMQLVQLLSPADRTRLLGRLRAHLLPDGVAALALVEEVPAGVDAPPSVPDIREVEGWVYSSLPLEVGIRDGSIVIRRLRQLLSPAGALGEEVDEVRLEPLSAAELEAEARTAGLRPAGRRSIPATEEHVASTVVLLAGER